MSLASDISTHMLLNGYTWNISGEMTSPSEQDVVQVLDNMKDRLYDEPEHTMMELGGIVMIKRQDHFDIYMRFGEINDS